ncbi:hypothetical protein ACTXO0_03105 [Glutamicibacter ardleyensis]|uniref:hypothetical protein n=1 Tax=Glutamicibacter ardleyensis TaxID=225894 RepID=UPI003FD4325F
MSEQDANKQFGNFDNTDNQETKQPGTRGDSNGSEDISRPTDIQQSYGAEEPNSDNLPLNGADETEMSEGATDIQQSYGDDETTSDRANQETNDS